MLFYLRLAAATVAMAVLPAMASGSPVPPLHGIRVRKAGSDGPPARWARVSSAARSARPSIMSCKTRAVSMSA